MKAENNTTDHNRTIRLTEIPGDGLKDLTVTVNYTHGENEAGALDKAVTLDSFVIPTLLTAVNSLDKIMAGAGADEVLKGWVLSLANCLHAHAQDESAVALAKRARLLVEGMK